MASNDRERPDQPGRPGPRRKRVPMWAVIIFAVVPGTLLTAAIFATVAYFAFRASRPTAPAVGAPAVVAAAAVDQEPARGPDGCYDADELKRYFEGKPEVVMVEFFGTPSKVVAAGQLTSYVFLCPTRHAATGKTGTMVIVIVDRHTVARVECGKN